MDEVLKIKKQLERAVPANDAKKALDLLRSLESIPMTLDLLQTTHIGMTVNKTRKALDNSEVSSLSKSMVKKWKKLLNTSSSSSNNTLSNANSNSGTNLSGSLGGSNSNSNISSSISDNNSSFSNNNNNNGNLNNASSGYNLNENSQHSNSNSSLHSPALSHSSNAGSSSLKNSDQHYSSDQPASGSSSTASSGSYQNQDSRAPEKRSAPVQTNVPTTTSDVRLKCRKLLSDALKKPLPKEMMQEPFLEEDILAARIEECIFQEFRNTDMKYKSRFRSRLSNLGDTKNPYLRLNVLRGDIPPEKIAKMTAEEMASDELKKEREKYTKEAINDHQMSLTSGTKTSEIKCPACKKFNVTYNQVQTRSADEPMTTFCYCNECGKRWKFC